MMWCAVSCTSPCPAGFSVRGGQGGDERSDHRIGDRKALKNMVSQAGFEPATFPLGGVKGAQQTIANPL